MRIAGRVWVFGSLAAVAVGLMACTSDLPNDLPETPQPPLVAPATRAKAAIPPRDAKPVQTEYGFIMPRAAWTDAPLRIERATTLLPVGEITIHHSGDGKPFTGESVAEIAAHLRAVRYAHLDRGMNDIAYHFAIDRVGRVWQLRWLAYEGQHVRPNKNGHANNPHNVGIVLLGDFNLQQPTVPQRDRLLELVRLLRGKYNLSASAVHYHGEIVETDCPGKNLVPLLTAARRRGLF